MYFLSDIQTDLKSFKNLTIKYNELLISHLANRKQSLQVCYKDLRVQSTEYWDKYPLLSLRKKILYLKACISVYSLFLIKTTMYELFTNLIIFL
jgi:hypothetical protein